MTSIHSSRPARRTPIYVRTTLAKTLLGLLASLPLAPAFANGVVHIPEPAGGFGLPPDPADGITFGSQYAITPGFDGLFYDAPLHEFNGEISLVNGNNTVWLYPLNSTGEYTLCIDAGARALYFQAISSWTDTNPSTQLDASGIYFGSGIAPFDTDLTRSASGVLQINGQTIITQNNLANYVTLTGTQTLTNKTIDAGQLTGTVSSSRLPSETTLLGSSIDLSSETTGTLPVAKGGTGATSYTTGDLLYAGSSSSLAKLPAATTGNALISGGTGAAPSWGKVGLSTHVTGTLPVASGGTGATTLTGILKGNGTGAVTTVTAPSGALVGTTDTQTLSNKTLTGPVQVNGSMTLTGGLGIGGAVSVGGGSAAGENALALGGEAIADHSAALTGGRAYGISSVAMSGGYAGGDGSVAMSGGTTSGPSSTAMGGATANGEFSTAMSGGYADGEDSTAMSGGSADGAFATAISGGSTSGEYSVAIGQGATAQSDQQIVVGTYNIIQSVYSTWVPTDELFTVGNGESDEARSNAFVIKKNGDTAIYGNLAVSGNITNPIFTGTVQLPADVIIGENTVTFPSGTGTLVTAAGTQTLTNKSIDATQLTGTVPASRLPAIDLASSTASTGNLAWNRVNKTGASLADLPTREFGALQNKPTTIAGYGISDALAPATTAETEAGTVTDKAVTPAALKNAGYLRVATNGSGRITTTLRIEPHGDVSMGEFGDPAP